MLIVSFYTKNTPYEQEINNLKKSCEQFGLKYHFEGYQGRGNWVLNCGIKPSFILDMLYREKDDLLYIDADGVIKQPLKYIDELPKEVDIAAHIRKGGEFLSGTVFFRNNERVKNLVKEWVKRQHKDPGIWDQKTLHETIVNHGPRLGIEFHELPQPYCKIFDKDNCETVIEHYQKSREYKEKVNMSEIDGVPSSVHNQRIRVHGDGSFTIPRRHPQAEAFMDSNYRRVHGELRWFKKSHESQDLMSLKPIFDNKECYIIGKGPSLDNLTEQAFAEEDAPVICLNESIHKVESLAIKNPIFVLQQDMGLRNTCKPSRGALLISTHAQHWYDDFKNKYIYNPREMGLHGNQLAVICAIEIAKILNTKSFNMLCFDACVNKNTAYAECIGHESTRGGDPSRFLKHPKHMEKHLKGYKINWVIPKALPCVTSDDNTESRQVHPEEHREHVHEESLKRSQDKQDQPLGTEPSQLEQQPDHSDN